MALVEVAVAVVRLEVVAVKWNDPAVGGNLVQIVRPGISKLRTHSVPGARAQRGLQCVVVGCTDTVELVDGAKVRILAKKRVNEVTRNRRIRNLLVDVT